MREDWIREAAPTMDRNGEEASADDNSSMR